MKPITSILAVTDFSSDGNNAVRRAALLAQEHGAGLKIVHVLDGSGGRSLRDCLLQSSSIDLQATQARASLRGLALGITGLYDVAVTAEVCVRQPVAALVQALQQVDLVVVGRGRPGLFLHWLRGCSLWRALRLCGRPVLTVKAPVDRSYQRSLVSIDFTAPSDAAVEVAAALLGEGRLRLFHAINANEISMLRHLDIQEHVARDHRERQKAGAVARMRRTAAQLGLRGTGVGFAAEHGHPVWSVLRHSATLGADLLVAGTQARSALTGFLIGSVSRRLVVESGGDVLLVPQASPAGPAWGASRFPQRRAA